MAQERFNVGGMTCAACQAHVEKAVCKLDGVSDVSVNLLSGSMQVTYDETALTNEDICNAVDRAGYSASPPSTPPGTAAGSTHAARALESPTKKLEEARARHAGAPRHLDRVSHPSFLPRDGAHARLAAAGVFRRAREHHESRAHRAAPARTHPLRQRRVLQKRVQVARPRRPHHGCAHRHRRHRERRLVHLRHLPHRRGARGGRHPRGARAWHGQPLPGERGHHPLPS